MKATTPRPILLKDYQPPSHLVTTIDLCFELHDEKTRVKSKMSLVQNGQQPQPLVLNGVGLELVSIRLDGKLLSASDYHIDDTSLTIEQVPKAFTLEVETLVNPAANTALDGLYKSGTIFCTQNEPEGFRHITYFLDRSDVMATYTTKIIADKTLYPVLLANGNCVDKGDLPDGRHWVLWSDPFPKPCYLFALVGGDLGSIFDSFTTRSGRKIDLRIYCDKGNEERCHHAMLSLKKSMKWDEDVFGLEYDLDIFMIVAVDAFNFGAMENKGLNIFNTNCVLADAKTATDVNYARVEKVVAHEYFHNWTGNRVTCRDWFQLTLKEGLTVFRDQEFSADMNSRPVERIDDVIALRARQFEEDAGPTAHPIQPQSYIQINNFYTATVYNKGAEVIRMIQTLIGKEAFRKGIDKYFELYDGQAVTTKDFVHAMELASGRDLTEFSRWYHQAGTPEVKLEFDYDAAKKTFAMTVEQSCAPTADGSPKEPFFFPLRVGLIGKKGHDLPLGRGDILEVSQAKEKFVFENIPEPPVPSVNRYFGAPIKVVAPYTHKDLIFLMAHDSDAVNRWEAGQELGCQLILQMLQAFDEGEELVVDDAYLDAFGIILADTNLDKALKAMALVPPSEETVGQRQEIIDFDGIHVIREYILQQVASTHREKLWKTYEENHTKQTYRFDANDVARRSLKNTALAILAYTGESDVIAQCARQFQEADNMTDRFAALKILADIGCPQRQQALSAFYNEWKHDKLVITKWLGIQAVSKLDNALKRVKELEKDPVFDYTIPNLVRALQGTFIHNNVPFNANNGEGYAYLADQILHLDKINPQMAAGLAGGFKKFAKLDVLRKKAMQVQLDRVLATPDLSQNVFEIVSKCRKNQS